MLHSRPHRCAETALAGYLEIVLGALQDTMSNIRINRYRDEHLGYLSAVPERQVPAGKWPGRRQTGGSGFAMAKRSTSHSHILSAFLFPIVVSCTVLSGLCTFCLHLSSFISSFVYCLWFIHFSFCASSILLRISTVSSPWFFFPSVS